MTGTERAKRIRRALEDMAREDAIRELQERCERLRNASLEEQRDILRQVMEAKRKRPKDHGLLPGRDV